MDSQMMYIPVQLEVCILQSYRCDPDLLDIRVYTMDCEAPKEVRTWVEKEVANTFERTREEERDMDSQCIRTFDFEVEVWYREVAGVPKAVKANCQTVCPQFVAAWVEQEAMKQFNRKEQSCGHETTLHQKSA